MLIYSISICIRFHDDIIIYPHIDSIVEFAAKHGDSDQKDQNENNVQSTKALLENIK